MNRTKFTTVPLFVAALFLYFSITLQTQGSPGDLDPSFSNGGKVVTPIGNGDESAYAVAIKSDGKIVAIGDNYNEANNGTDNNFELARYNTDGSLDISFRIVGKVVTLIGEESYASALAFQSDDKIVVAGTSYNGNNPFFI